MQTPYGAPSAPLVVGEVGGKRVAFLPRHGRHHELPPHRIPYRANVWAMRELGARRIIAPCASGALQPELELGTFVVCDQFLAAIPTHQEVSTPTTRIAPLAHLGRGSGKTSLLQIHPVSDLKGS